jgi:hypothetical protein
LNAARGRAEQVGIRCRLGAASRWDIKLELLALDLAGKQARIAQLAVLAILGALRRVCAAGAGPHDRADFPTACSRWPSPRLLGAGTLSVWRVATLLRAVAVAGHRGRELRRDEAACAASAPTRGAKAAQRAQRRRDLLLVADGAAADRCQPDKPAALQNPSAWPPRRPVVASAPCDVGHMGCCCAAGRSGRHRRRRVAYRGREGASVAPPTARDGAIA